MNFNDKDSKRYKHKKTFNKRNNILVVVILAIIFVMLIAVGIFLISKFQNKKSAAQNSDSNSTTPTITLPTKPEEVSHAFEIADTITARNVLIADANSGTILSSKGDINEKVYPASLTKLLAALVIMDNCSADEIFTVGAELSFVQAGSSTAKLLVGSEVPLDAMLDALLISSGNDASYTSAVHIGKKVGGERVRSDLDALQFFMELMNKKAQDLGAVNSNFVNPDGYHQNEHYTTSGDLLIIAKAAYSNDSIRASVSKTKSEYSIKVNGKTQNMLFESTNALLKTGIYNFPGANGLKTGTTNEAGSCLISTVEKNGKSLICIVLGATSRDTLFKETLSLLNKAFE